MRAFFANGVDEMHVPWAVEGLPTLLHLSLFLFFAGLVVFLFNVDQEVFTCVVCWILFFSLMYGLITLLPLIRHDSPYNTPLSILTWFLYARILYVAFKVLASFRRKRYRMYPNQRYQMQWRFSRWMSGGVEKRAEEMAEEQSSEIDVRILGWTLSALGDDDSLEKFFEAIPGLFNSNLVNHLERDFPKTVLETFFGALNGFMGRTSSSNSVTEPVKSRRVIICRDIMNMIPCPYTSLKHDLHSRARLHEEPVSIDRLQAMARWYTHLSRDVSDTARNGVISRLLKLQERDGRWIRLVSDACGLAAQDIQRNVVMRRDDMLLATLIGVSRHAIHSHEFDMLVLVEALTQFDIRHTLPRLQHDFCTLWNELAQEARKGGFYKTPLDILLRIRHFYITLHQGTDAAPTAFSASTYRFDLVLRQPSSYPLCDIAGHRPDSSAHVPVPNSRPLSLLTQSTDSSDTSPHHSTSGGDDVSQQLEQPNIIGRPPSPSDPTISSEIRDSSQAPEASSPALPVHTSSRSTETLLPGALQDIPPVATLSRPLEGTTLQDVVVSCAEPDTSEILSAASSPAPTPTLAPVPESTPPVRNESSTSCDADAASASNPLLPASSVVDFSVPASPPSLAPPSPNAELLVLLDCMTPSRPTGNAALPHLRARRLVNSGNMCFTNSVLQLLVYSPPLWNLFRQLDDLKGQRGTGGPNTSGGGTPLVDATVRFFEEFMNKEEPPPTQQPTQQAAGGNPRESEVAKKEPNAVDPFEPMYLYDAMKKKRQLKLLLVGSHAS
jgi:hypothetical protein